MVELWLPQADIPAEGRDFLFADPAIWSEAWHDANAPRREGIPLSATLHVVFGQDGFFVSGVLTGSVVFPCNRCAEDAEVELAFRFDDYLEPAGDEVDEDSKLVRWGQKGLELDAAGLLWEQLVLALPVKPLCRENCTGLCLACGINLNFEQCDCVKGAPDPRWDALKNLTASH